MDSPKRSKIAATEFTKHEQEHLPSKKTKRRNKAPEVTGKELTFFASAGMSSCLTQSDIDSTQLFMQNSLYNHDEEELDFIKLPINSRRILLGISLVLSDRALYEALKKTVRMKVPEFNEAMDKQD